jgi:hypothetical protein
LRLRFRPQRQVFSRGIVTATNDSAIDQNQRQALDAVFVQHLLDGRVASKLGWFLSQIESLNAVALLFQPIQVGCEPWQRFIHLGPANTGAATHCSVINLNVTHCYFLSRSPIAARRYKQVK